MFVLFSWKASFDPQLSGEKTEAQRVLVTGPPRGRGRAE